MASTKVCVQKLCCDEGFTKVREEATAAADALPKSTTPKRRRTGNTNINDYLVEEMTGQRENDIETELKRLYYRAADSVVGEINQRFGEQNSHLFRALAALDPESDSFLDPETVKHIMDLTQSPIVDAEFCKTLFEVAKGIENRGRTGPQNSFSPSITAKFKVLQTLSSVLTVFKHALTFSASTVTCQNIFSSLHNVFMDAQCFTNRRPS